LAVKRPRCTAQSLFAKRCIPIPRISAVLGTCQTSVSGLSELRNYWRKALDAAKEIRFEIASVGVGSDALTIVYRNHRDDHVAETLVFGEDGKVIEGIVTYLMPPEK
jgi:hypothetical protein